MFQDLGKYFALNIRYFVVNQFLLEFYDLCGELLYCLFYIRVILPKKTVSSLKLSGIILL